MGKAAAAWVTQRPSSGGRMGKASGSWAERMYEFDVDRSPARAVVGRREDGEHAAVSAPLETVLHALVGAHLRPGPKEATDQREGLRERHGKPKGGDRSEGGAAGRGMASPKEATGHRLDSADRGPVASSCVEGRAGWTRAGR
eukprot:1912789-Prymnesium_polylepis.1